MAITLKIKKIKIIFVPPFDGFLKRRGILLLLLSQYLGPASTSGFCNIVSELNFVSLIKKENF